MPLAGAVPPAMKNVILEVFFQQLNSNENTDLNDVLLLGFFEKLKEIKNLVLTGAIATCCDVIMMKIFILPL